MDVYRTLKTCALKSTLTDLKAFCTQNTGACTSQKYFENVTQNMFALMAKFPELTALKKEFPAESAEELY